MWSVSAAPRRCVLHFALIQLPRTVSLRKNLLVYQVSGPTIGKTENYWCSIVVRIRLGLPSVYAADMPKVNARQKGADK